jgi:hypothetical protein
MMFALGVVVGIVVAIVGSVIVIRVVWGPKD